MNLLITFFIITALANAVEIFRNYDMEKFSINNRPIIGILSQEVSTKFQNKYCLDENIQSYIAASYVKFVENSGARVVPIWIGQNRKYYENLMTKINGVLFPGGATFFNKSGGYAEAGHYIYDIAREMNDNGNFMPIWGTCLGFELLTYLSANNTEHRTNCYSQSQALPLNFRKGFEKSKMFGSAPADIIEILRKENVTINFHMFCVTQEGLLNLGIKEWKILSTNYDWRGQKFISAIEHKKYPFFGVQFHPEKNIYEFIKHRNISHTFNAIKASRYFADFFVNESRKNFNKFPSRDDEINELIYNYAPIYSGRQKSAFEQMYVFDQQDNRNNVSQNILCI